MTAAIPINLPRRPGPPPPGSSPAASTITTKSLAARLAAVLPKLYKFHLYHVSTPPTKTVALCSAPPGERDDRTYVEKHFLAVAIDVPPPPPPSSTGPPAEAAAEDSTTSPKSTITTSGTNENTSAVDNAPKDDGDASTTPSKTTARQQQQQQVMILGVEIFIYSTAHNTIYFVAKADSTGYLTLLSLPHGTPSPIREISSSFLAHLVESHHRPGVQDVVSLFARSQAQYLFPGSIENSTKHVLDDRGLVRWWCRVLNSMLEEGDRIDSPLAPSPTAQLRSISSSSKKTATTKPTSFTSTLRSREKVTKKAYLLVPGLDKHETAAFLPKTSSAKQNWVLGHPLHQISHYAKEYDWVPPRCLIPRFPDDPKSRFRDELDEETHSANGTQTTGAWKSVGSLEMFWDMMAFRQECSSGALTGFVWVVWDPISAEEESGDEELDGEGLGNGVGKTEGGEAPSTPPRKGSMKVNANPSPLKSIAGTPVKTPRPSHLSSSSPPPASPSRHDANPNTNSTKKQQTHKKLTGPIRPRKPRVKTHKHAHLAKLPVSTSYYFWPEGGRGKKLVDERGYDGISKLLLKLDFANLDIAARSTWRWATEVGQGDLAAKDGEEGVGWGESVVGLREVPGVGVTNGNAVVDVKAGTGTVAGVTNWNGLVKRKRSETTTITAMAGMGGANGTGTGNTGVNMLGAGLVRKKVKAEHAQAPEPEKKDKEEESADAPKVNVLRGELVRKKFKA
ncbi:hypothetical protein MKZ38_005781 [Zalerion maritima]|uniref:histone acetyltransferase n=1 Tax=Zalerion maritima TaxID=339359 RepID=A0AAD5WP24_9PEZI|nr:hypothetical protein MKZ38_005781 [Zalerion maritima]